MNFALPSRCALAIALLVVLAESTAARAETFEEHASDILNDAWRPSPQALATAAAAHAQATAINADDHRADYALALAQMRSGKWESAGESLARAVSKNPKDLYVWRAQVWLCLYQRQYAEALAAIDRLARIFPKEPDADPKAEARWTAAAKIMGRAYGYIAGPRSGAISVEELAASETKLTAKFTPDRQRAFAAGRAEVVAAHGEALAAIDGEQQAASDTKLEENAEQREFIDSERARITTEAASLQEQAASAKSQLDADVSVIDQELTPIQQRFNEVQIAAQPSVTRLTDIDRRLKVALQEAARSDAGDGKDQERVRRDNERRMQAARDAENVRNEFRREQELLLPYQVEGQRLQAAAAGLEQRKAAAVATYRRTVGSLTAAMRKLQRIEKQLHVSERGLAAPAGKSATRAENLKAQVPLLTTYEKFPLEQERLRLLKEFEPR